MGEKFTGGQQTDNDALQYATQLDSITLGNESHNEYTPTPFCRTLDTALVYAMHTHFAKKSTLCCDIIFCCVLEGAEGLAP